MTDVGDAQRASPCLALDIGGTKVEAAIVLADGSLVRRERFYVDERTQDLFGAIVALARRVIGEDVMDVFVDEDARALALGAVLVGWRGAS